MRLANAFLSGMRSAYEISPKEDKYTAHFVTVAEAKVINLHTESDLAASWKEIAYCQKNAFNKISKKSD